MAIAGKPEDHRSWEKDHRGNVSFGSVAQCGDVSVRGTSAMFRSCLVLFSSSEHEFFLPHRTTRGVGGAGREDGSGAFALRLILTLLEMRLWRRPMQPATAANSNGGYINM